MIDPRELRPRETDYPDATIHSDLREGIEGADVVMALRIQRERMADEAGLASPDEYFRSYGFTGQTLRLAAPAAIVRHPGPMNRNVEIAGSVANGTQSAIERPVTSGLAARMAVLATIGENRTSR